MRRALGSVVVVLALAGCTGQQAASAPAPVATSSRPTMSAVDQTFVKLMGDRFPGSTVQVMMEGRAKVCARLDADPTTAQWLALVKVYMDAGGMSASDAGYAIGLDIGTGCPNHESVVPAV